MLSYLILIMLIVIFVYLLKNICVKYPKNNYDYKK